MPGHEKSAHGLYSSKIKGNNKGSDNFGKPYVFLNGEYAGGKVEQRDCYKGKQIITGSHVDRDGTVEGKKFKEYIAYASEPFDDNPTVEKVRKLGFCTGRELSRDDLSSTVQILRYRHHLLGEQKTEAKHAAASPPRAAAPPSATQAALAASQALRATAGLASVIPTFTNEFDRQRHVAEFSTRVLPPAVRSTRIHGSTRPISTDIGEGAFDKNLLKSPQYATLKPGQMSIVHATVGMLSPSMVA